MSILLIGMNHKTAPVELREQLSLAGCGLAMALEELNQCIQNPSSDAVFLREGVILSTCNRLELYLSIGDNGKLSQDEQLSQGRLLVENYLCRLQDLALEEVQPHLYCKADQEAITHLMQVASGLDSMILGEPQILGQVSSAYKAAHTAGTTGPILSHLCTQSIHAGKRARNETAISRHTTSVSHAAAQLAREQLGELERVRTLIVGAGEMAELAAKAMQMNGAQMLHVINRTYATAEQLAQSLGCQAIAWQRLPEALCHVDLVITGTGAPHTIIHTTDVEPILAQRNGQPLLFVDIAVPRDVEEAVGELSGVTRYDVDDLQTVLDANIAHRQAAIPQVMQIIQEELAAFEQWVQSRQVVPVIIDLRQKAKKIATAEVAEAVQRLGVTATEKEEQIIERLAHRLVNKLLHEPTVRLKDQAANGDGYAYAHAVRELFALDQEQGIQEDQYIEQSEVDRPSFITMPLPQNVH